MSEGSKKSGVVGQIVVAVVIALMVGGTSPWWWKEMFGGSGTAGSGAGGGKPPPPKKFRFEVIEMNPFTGGEVQRAAFKNAHRARYTNTCSAYRKVHWVRWRFVGISEPLKTKRFGSSLAAQSFIDRGGPLAPFRILSEPARIVRARVSCRAIPLQPQ